MSHWFRSFQISTHHHTSPTTRTHSDISTTANIDLYVFNTVWLCGFPIINHSDIPTSGILGNQRHAQSNAHKIHGWINITVDKPSQWYYKCNYTHYTTISKHRLSAQNRSFVQSHNLDIPRLKHTPSHISPIPNINKYHFNTFQL